MNTLSSRFVAFATAAGAFSLLFTNALLAQTTQRMGDNVRTEPPPDTATLGTAETWSAEEFQRAQPLPLETAPEDSVNRLIQAPEITGPQMRQRLEALEDMEMLGLTLPVQEMAVDLGGPPGGVEPPSEEPAPLTSLTGGYTYPAPFTGYEIFTDYTQYPYSAIGKLFFRVDGIPFVCSAAAIGNHAIWTAGHCVHEGNGSDDGWHTDVVFVPAYKDGESVDIEVAAPLGVWEAAWLSTKTDWFENGNPNGLTADMGGAVMAPNNEGQSLAQVTGFLGFSWDQPRASHWNAFGYPAEPPFDGERLFMCGASAAYNGTVSGVPPVGIGCNMTGGSSGGPWVLRFGRDNLLNGNNSYHRTTFPLEMFSPYFDERAKSLKDSLATGSPTS